MKLSTAVDGLQEIVFTHHDLEEDEITRAAAVFSKDWSDAQICDSIRNGLVARGDIELDELDLDEDGVVIRTGDKFTVTWTHSRGSKSMTTLQF